REKRNVQVTHYLCSAHWVRAVALTELGRHGEALQDWQKALELDAGSQRDTLRLGRAGTRVRQGEHAEATQEADTLAAAVQSTGEMQYRAACIYSLSVAACLADVRLSPAEQQ